MSPGGSNQELAKGAAAQTLPARGPPHCRVPPAGVPFPAWEPAVPPPNGGRGRRTGCRGEREGRPRPVGEAVPVWPADPRLVPAGRPAAPGHPKTQGRRPVRDRDPGKFDATFLLAVPNMSRKNGLLPQ